MLFLVAVGEAVSSAAARAFDALIAWCVDRGFARGPGAGPFAEQAVRLALPCCADRYATLPVIACVGCVLVGIWVGRSDGVRTFVRMFCSVVEAIPPGVVSCSLGTEALSGILIAAVARKRQEVELSAVLQLAMLADVIYVAANRHVCSSRYVLVWIATDGV